MYLTLVRRYNGETMDENEKKLAVYLCSVVNQGCVQPHTAVFAWFLWKALRSTVRMPNVAPGPNGQLLLMWNTGPHHLEAEIFPDGTVEYFYIHHDTNRMVEATVPIMNH